jgi:hypothetical protein
MLTLTRILAATAVVAVAATAPASAATKKRTFKYSATVLSTPVSTANGYPAVGGTALNAGSLKSAPFGEEPSSIGSRSPGSPSRT